MPINRIHLPALLAAAGIAAAGPADAQETPGFCQIGFAAGETASDAIFTMTEVEAMRGREFEALDADGDGRVTLQDYRACHGLGARSEILPRNVSATGSGELDDAGLRVELDTLTEGGGLSRADFMAEAALAYDATGNEEDNQLEWARAFIVLLPGEEESDVSTFGRSEYAARAAALFRRLDTDGDGQLTAPEWSGEAAAGDGMAGTDEAYKALDRDQSGDVTAEEYATAGADRARAARDAALEAGWEDHGDYAAGIGTDEGPGNVVSTSSEGLVDEGTETPDAPAADGSAAVEPPPTPPKSDGGSVPVFFYFFQE